MIIHMKILLSVAGRSAVGIEAQHFRLMSLLLLIIDPWIWTVIRSSQLSIPQWLRTVETVALFFVIKR